MKGVSISDLTPFPFVDATSVTIDNGIGEVSEGGSITISPTETTTYTITATGTAGTFTDTVTVTVEPFAILIDSPLYGDYINRPDVNVQGSVYNPQGIEIGITVNGVLAMVDGNQFVANHIPVDGMETILTATVGAPGASQSYIYTVSSADISVEQENLLVGDATTLSWNFVDATLVTIDNGIGEVSGSGSITISPTETTTYTITATGTTGTFTDTVTVTVELFAIWIDSPQYGDYVNRPDVNVEGTVYNPQGIEIGITVNGILAVVDGDRFVANHVPVDGMETVLTANAVDMEENSSEYSVVVSPDLIEDYVIITADPQSGVEPFETTLRINSSFDFNESSISCTGPGTVVYSESSSEEYLVSIIGPGLYSFSVEVMDPESNAYEDKIAILVLEEATLDGLLTQKWENMRQALIDGNIEKAALSFRNEKRGSYMEFLQLIPNDQVNDFIPRLDRIDWIGYDRDVARYVASIDIIVNGEPKSISSYIIFEIDGDGLWRISFF